MATQWVLDKVSNALQPTIQSTVSSAGGMAGGAFHTVGNSINGVGQSINGTIKRYGDGVMDYGNGVLDWTKGTGTRGQTASNPLGLSSNTSGGKRSVTSPSVYTAPKSTSKTLTTTGKTAAPVKKKVPATQLSSPVKKTTTTPPRGGAPKATKVGATKSVTPVKKAVGTAKVKPAPAVRASTASATRARMASSYAPSSAASNPLGLK